MLHSSVNKNMFQLPDIVGNQLGTNRVGLLVGPVPPRRICDRQKIVDMDASYDGPGLHPAKIIVKDEPVILDFKKKNRI